jgi:hypothetical protein
VDLDEILFGGDDVEYCLLQAYVGKVGVLVLPRTSYVIHKAMYVGLYRCLAAPQTLNT